MSLNTLLADDVVALVDTLIANVNAALPCKKPMYLLLLLSAKGAIVADRHRRIASTDAIVRASYCSIATKRLAADGG